MKNNGIETVKTPKKKKKKIRQHVNEMKYSNRTEKESFIHQGNTS